MVLDLGQKLRNLKQSSDRYRTLPRFTLYAAYILPTLAAKQTVTLIRLNVCCLISTVSLNIDRMGPTYCCTYEAVHVEVSPIDF